MPVHLQELQVLPRRGGAVYAGDADEGVRALSHRVPRRAELPAGGRGVRPQRRRQVQSSRGPRLRALGGGQAGLAAVRPRRRARGGAPLDGSLLGVRVRRRVGRRAHRVRALLPRGRARVPLHPVCARRRDRVRGVVAAQIGRIAHGDAV